MKIVIIKLGADGDVIRTLPLAVALKKKYLGSELTWITKGDVAELIRVDYIDKILRIPYNGNEIFDILFNFDVESDALNLANSIKAEKKYGFYSDSGYPATFNLGAEYYLNTMFDDEMKKKNRKTYQEMMFEAAELPYNKEHGEILSTDKEYANRFVKNNGIKIDKLIGIHMGASSRWPSKVWDEGRLKEFIKKAKEKGYEILLFGGPNEVKQHETIVEEMKKEKIDVYRNNPLNSKSEFVALVDLCKVMICSDSFALHISIALKKKTIGLFFCTPPWEIEGYGFLKKLVAKDLEKFFPERMDVYDRKLTRSISADEVLKAVEEFLV